MNKLEKARAQIDKIDAQMATLFERRMALAAEIAQIKKQQDLPLLDAAREKEIVVKQATHLRDKTLQPYYIKFMGQMFTLSRKYQAQLTGRTTVAYPGGEKAAAQQVAQHLLPGAQPTAAGTLADVFRTVEAGEAAYGVVPFETSGSGETSGVLKLCYQHQCYISAMADLPAGQGKTTRFMVLAHQAPQQGDRIALMATVDNEVGNLAHLIEIMAEEGFAIEALKSQPVKKKAAKTTYYFELVLPPEHERLAPLLEHLQQASLELRVLGVYDHPRQLAPAGQAG